MCEFLCVAHATPTQALEPCTSAHSPRCAIKVDNTRMLTTVIHKQLSLLFALAHQDHSSAQRLALTLSPAG